MLAVVLSDFVDGHDVRMLQIGRRLRFTTEALNLGLAREFSGENHFQRDRAIEARLPGFPNNAHAAARDFLLQFIITERAHGRESLGTDGDGRAGLALLAFARCLGIWISLARADGTKSGGRVRRQRTRANGTKSNRGHLLVVV